MSRTAAEESASKRGNVQVLRSGPIPEVDLSPPVTAQMLASAAPGVAGMQPGAIDRPTQMQNIDAVAPVVADARSRNRAAAPESEGAEEGVKIVLAMVTNDKPITVFDRGSGNRVQLKSGKQLSSQHYDLMDLRRQGVRLAKVEEKADPNDIPDSIFG